jgi:hypothetical protein
MVIIKIKSTQRHYSTCFQHLSFTKGQEFYALGLDKDDDTFFVSNNYRTPFGRGSINGKVPSNMFVKTEN